MGKSLYEKVFDKHAVRQLASGQHQLLMGLHLIHEVTSHRPSRCCVSVDSQYATQSAPSRPAITSSQRIASCVPSRTTWPNKCWSSSNETAETMTSAISPPQRAAAVSKVIRQLLYKGLITVSISDSDGRQRLYELSAEGKALMRRLRARRKRAIEAIWAPLPKEELHQFEEFSARLIEAHERYAEEED